MIKTKPVTKIEQKIEDVLCNKCGQSTGTKIYKGSNLLNFNYVDIKTVWGYPSNHNKIMTEAQICEKCWFIFAELFVIKQKETPVVYI
jgi:protein-arginine kinase activator protein McsA